MKILQNVVNLLQSRHKYNNILMNGSHVAVDLDVEYRPPPQAEE